MKKLSSKVLIVLILCTAMLMVLSSCKNNEPEEDNFEGEESIAPPSDSLAPWVSPSSANSTPGATDAQNLEVLPSEPVGEENMSDSWRNALDGLIDSEVTNPEEGDDSVPGTSFGDNFIAGDGTETSASLPDFGTDDFDYSAEEGEEVEETPAASATVNVDSSINTASLDNRDLPGTGLDCD